MNDNAYVSQLPNPIVEYNNSDSKNEEVLLEEGFVAAINGKRYFIHCVATLPITEFNNDLEFGLWVEVSREDMFRYHDVQSNDDIYSKFECEGVLANNWPLFPYTYGNRVRIKVIDQNSKPFIVEIDSDDVELNKYKTIGSLSSERKNSLRKRLAELYVKLDS